MARSEQQAKTNRVARAGATSAAWWQGAIGYSLYLRSFADGNGDGVGDLRGATRHLDHLAELGIDLLWISPFYPSPMADGGYDVVDYYGVDPLFGDTVDFDELVNAAHERGIAIVVDLVANHTSVEHPWFQAARSSREHPRHDHYLWADPAPGGGPPNNWVSYFGGSAWTFDSTIGQYYLHLFLVDQPDLNWRNPAVVEAFDHILRFWLECGVDGFRVDVAQGLVKDEQLRSNPQRHGLLPGSDRIEEWGAFEHRHDVLQPESVEVFRRWKAMCADYDAVLIGEVSVGEADAYAAVMVDGGLDIGMWLEPMHVEWSAEPLRTVLRSPLDRIAGRSLVGWQGSSLDEPRAASRFGGGEIGRRRALALATLLVFLPGVPFLYQGEELGLEQGEVPETDRVDPVGVDAAAGRDGCRTPMPWTTESMHGFTTGETTWLPFADDAPAASVEIQRRSTTSSFARYRSLLAARREHLGTNEVTIDWPEFAQPDLIGFRRGALTVMVNSADDPIVVNIDGTVVFDSLGCLDDRSEQPSGSAVCRVRLEGAQAVVIRTDRKLSPRELQLPTS